MVAGAVAEGIRFLDHTADLGMDVDAPSLHELLHRAAVGMLMLLRGEEDEPAPPGGEQSEQSEQSGRDTRTAPIPMDLSVREPPQLVAAWLREVLYLHEVHALDYVALEERTLSPTRLIGRIRTRRGGQAVREIKGVTYHALEMAEGEAGWHTRIIFDV